MRLSSKEFLVCAVVAGATVVAAATNGIGVVMSQGNIFVNSALIAGNTTLADGSTVETQNAASQVRLNGGAHFGLASSSKAKVFADHLDLQQGTARISDYAANARGLNVRALGGATADVSMRDKGVVQVAALSGSVHVYNAAGINVANVVPGLALDLMPQDAGANPPSSLTGCAYKTKTATLLTDDTTNVTVQLQGNVRTGRHVQVTGAMVPNSTPQSPATQVINVTSVKEVSGACKPGTAAAAAAGVAGGAAAAGAAGAGGAAAGAAAGAGAAAAGIGATTAVVVGVGAAAAATVGGLAGSGVIGGSNSGLSGSS